MFPANAITVVEIGIRWYGRADADGKQYFRHRQRRPDKRRAMPDSEKDIIMPRSPTAAAGHGFRTVADR
jgi:hypothetical protein